MDFGSLPEDALPFSTTEQVDATYRRSSTTPPIPSHSPPNANEETNSSTNIANDVAPALEAEDIERMHAEAIADLFGTDPSPAQSPSQSPDHPPPAPQDFYSSTVPAQSSAYSLIDPELRLPFGKAWNESDTEVSDPDFFQATRRSSVDSGLGEEVGQQVAAPGFLTPDTGAEVGEGVPPPKPKKSHARKQPPGHIPRARNAFILFRKHITDSNLIPASVEIKHQNISVVAAKMWREAPPDVRGKFQEMARIEKEEHQRRYPGYRYQPVFRRTDIIRRRVRKEAHEDDKVEAVAELLMKGKAGTALEREIKDQLKDLTGEESDSGVESSADSTSSRRRNRRQDAGQLSKGAIRAQKAQNRARALRQSAYDAEMVTLQHTQFRYGGLGQSDLTYAQDDSYIVDYHGHSENVPQRRSTYGAYGYSDSQPFADPSGLYPPVQAADGGFDDLSQLHSRPWPDQHQQPYYDPTTSYQAQVTNPAYFTHPEPYNPGPQYDDQPLVPTYASGDYSGVPVGDPADANQSTFDRGFGVTARPADIIAGQYARGVDAHTPEDNDQGEDPRMRDWGRDQLPTPSNHVSFQDDLFAGEGGLGLDRDLHEYVGAMEQAEHERTTGW